MAEDETDLSKVRRRVDLAFGRCLLRLQALELATKGLLAGADQVIGAEAVEPHAKATLGTLARALSEGFLQPLGQDGEGPGDEDAGSWAAGTARLRFRIGLPPEELARTGRDLAELVAGRNDLVHHFLDRHDLSTRAGCSAALHHLARVDGQVATVARQLSDWARDMERMGRALQSFLKDSEVQAALLSASDRAGKAG